MNDVVRPALEALDRRALGDLMVQIQKRVADLDYEESITKRGAETSFSLNRNAMGVAGRSMTDEEILTKVFQYHDDPKKVPNYIAVRTAAKNFAQVILQNVPPCADRTTALRTVRESVMWANAAIALDGLSL